MIEVRDRTDHRLAFGVAIGAALTALVMVAGTALAQNAVPTPMPMLNMQAMIDACLAIMGSMMSGMQGMMSGMCMMGR
jgi:hypothetical protein